MSELTTDKALSFIADGLCDCMGTLEEHHTNGCPQDEVAVAWLTQVQREAAVKALREAADDMDARANKNGLIAGADRWEGYYSGVLSSILKETSALRARADRMAELNDIKIDTLYKSAQALISQIDNLNKDNNPLFALGVTASAQVLIDAARSI